MKVFISMPMAGKSKQEILQERQEIIDKLGERFKVVDIIDNYFEDFDSEVKGNQIRYLARSIAKLADADIVCVGRDWHKARGCRIECEVAREYNIPILVMEEYLKQE